MKLYRCVYQMGVETALEYREVTFPSSFSIIFSYAFFTRSNSKHCGV